MIPPSFSDLGKAAKDLFDKKFKFGLFGIECTTSTDPITVKIEGSHDLKTKGLVGSFETKHKGIYDTDVTTKWSSKNILTGELSKSFMWLQGLKCTSVATFEPDTGKKTLKIKENYKRDLVNFNGELFFDSIRPLLNFNVVFGCTEPRTYLAGADIHINTKTFVVTKQILAIGYQTHGFSVVSSVQNCSLFSTLVHQKVTDDSDIAASVSYNKDNQEMKFGLVGRYMIPSSNGSFIKAKIDQSSRVGLVYGTTVRHGVELSISGEIDVKNVELGHHNIGLGLVYEP